MTAADCEISVGTLPSLTVSEDASLRVLSVTSNFTREYTDFMDTEGCIGASNAKNPTATIDFEAEVTGTTGLVTQHPGTEVSSLNNYASTTRGFDPSDGILQMQDASNTVNENESPTTNFSVRHLPHAA